MGICGGQSPGNPSTTGGQGQGRTTDLPLSVGEWPLPKGDGPGWTGSSAPLAFSPDAAIASQAAGAARIRLASIEPLAERHQPAAARVQAVEEPGDLLATAGRNDCRGTLVVPAGGLRAGPRLHVA